MANAHQAAVFVDAMKERYRTFKDHQVRFDLPDEVTDENLVPAALAGAMFTHRFLPMALSMGARRLVYQVTTRTAAKIGSLTPDVLQARICQGLKDMGVSKIYWRNCRVTIHHDEDDDSDDDDLAFDHSALLVGETVPELVVARVDDYYFLHTDNV